jgi:hypothetical protein
MDPIEISRRYSIQVAPIVKEIADKGLENCSDLIKKAVIKL